MRKIHIGNDYDLHRTGVSSRGTLQTGLTVRGFLAATPDGTAIDPTLEVVLTELAPGDYIGTLQGYDLTAQLLPLWEAATRNKLTVYERVVVDTEDYGDVAPLQVERDRPPTEPEEEE